MTRQNENQSIERCKNIFVTWSWLVLILVGMLTSVVGSSIYFGMSAGEIKQRLVEVEKDIEDLSRMEKKIDLIIEYSIRPVTSRIDSILIGED